MDNVDQVEGNMTVQTRVVKAGLKRVDQVKNIIAISSAKGGVGKSTLTVNLALALQRQGARVALLDADIYGPSQPHMLGATSKPETKDNKLVPLQAYGLQTMSIGYLVDQDTPMIWRGPMVTKALQQLLYDTLWQDVDYLLIDLPPGTGDIQLTLAQKIPLTGVVIVTTPQPIACLDTVKGLQMFKKVNIPILGVVENMSHFICPHCQQDSQIFGVGGAQEIAQSNGIELLGSVPLSIDIREKSDEGKPIVEAAPDSPSSKCYTHIARNLVRELEKRPKDYSTKFPEIVIE
jgi:ATP-binding protein involved in chromosome partitioning